MSKFTPLEELAELRKDDFLKDNLHLDRQCRYTVIQKALEDYEWILSKLDLDFLDRLNTEDKIKLAKILGAKIDYE